MVILKKIKEDIGYPDTKDFDSQILANINLALAEVYIGGGFKTNISLTDTSTEEDIKPFMKKNEEALYNMIYAYVMIRVRVLFDTPVGTLLNHLVKSGEFLLWQIREY